MDRLAAMVSFRRVVETRSFSSAARRLGVSAALVSRQIAWLEEELGVVLLHRSTRSVTPSEVGARFYERCVAILDDLEAAEADVRSDRSEPRGWIRVNAPVSFGIARLGPIVARFRERYPLVRVDLALTDEQVNPTAEGADVVVRITRSLADTSYAARRIGSMHRVLCASPTYLDRRGRPATVAALAEHDCVTYSMLAQPASWRFETDAGPAEVRVDPVLAANNSLLLRDALLAGAGIGIVPSYLVEDDLSAGRLEPVLPGARPPVFDIHALTVPRRGGARVAAFVDFLAAALADR